MRAFEGIIISKRMAKTAVVRVDRLRRHPKYRKAFRTSRKYKAHVEDAIACGVGDRVRIAETRPLSKGKRWKVMGVVRRALTDEVESEASEAGSMNQES